MIDVTHDDAAHHPIIELLIIASMLLQYSHCKFGSNPSASSFLNIKVSSLLSSSSRRHQICIPSAFYTTYSDSRESHLPQRPPRTQPLAGTVPYHVSYLFLHTHQAPENWPKTFTFPLFLQLKDNLVGKHNVLVNVCWTPASPTVTCPSPAPSPSLDTPPSPSSRPIDPPIDHEIVVHSGTLWIKGNTTSGDNLLQSQDICTRINLPIITPDTILSIFNGDNDDGNNMMVHLGPGVDLELITDHGTRSAPYSVKSRNRHLGPYFYICCHARRDCRCGIRGGDLADALASELTKRNMLLDDQGRSRLARVGHVGGHKNAPNVIVFPHGDWYGNLHASDLPGLVNHYVQSVDRTSTSQSERSSSSSSVISNFPNKFQWRGRMGMTKEAQRAIWESWAQHNNPNANA